MPNETLMLARQPICDRQLKVIAYELLFRGTDQPNEQARLSQGDWATSAVLLNTFTELGVEQVVNKKAAFINFTRNLLLNLPKFNKHQFVIELLEDIEVDDELLQALDKLHSQGYQIALDDFVLNDNNRALLPYAKYIKVDVLEVEEKELRAQVAQLKQSGATLLAEKVESHERYQLCKDLGFELFQGYFFAKPQLLKGKKNSENKQVILELISEMQDPDVDLAKLEKVIAKDPQISYKILKIVNSSAFRRGREIESLHQAIVILGLDDIRNWANLLALGRLQDKPAALQSHATMRARLCSNIGQLINPQLSHSAFTVGLLSTLDAFFDETIVDLIGRLSLSSSVAEALLNRSGVLGLILDTSAAYQEARWPEIRWPELAQLQLENGSLENAYQDALSWCNRSETLF